MDIIRDLLLGVGLDLTEMLFETAGPPQPTETIPLPMWFYDAMGNPIDLFYLLTPLEPSPELQDFLDKIAGYIELFGVSIEDRIADYSCDQTQLTITGNSLGDTKLHCDGMKFDTVQEWWAFLTLGIEIPQGVRHEFDVEVVSSSGPFPGVQMVSIPSGTFMMGSDSSEPCRDPNEDPVHQVTISSFQMQNTEVTQGQWTAIFGNNPSSFDQCGNDCPVEEVTWYDVAIFCNRLSQHEGYRPAYYSNSGYTTVFDGTPPVTSGSVYWDESANGYRLPTESEWEYAARAGTTGPFAFSCPTYNSSTCGLSCNATCLDAFAWYCGNANSTTHQVGQLQGNGWGLFDMHGNVWEWCWDWYTSTYPTGPVTDPTGPTSGSDRVFRGGDWRSSAGGCRSAFRINVYPYYRCYDLGFRLARTP